MREGGQPSRAMEQVMVGRESIDLDPWLPSHDEARGIAEGLVVARGEDSPSPYLADPRTDVAWRRLDEFNARLRAREAAGPTGRSVSLGPELGEPGVPARDSIKVYNSGVLPGPGSGENGVGSGGSSRDPLKAYMSGLPPVPGAARGVGASESPAVRLPRTPKSAPPSLGR